MYHGFWRGIPVAIKEVSIDDRPSAMEAFDRELRILADLNHPHVVKLLGYTVSEGRGFLVLEYCPNLSLDDWLYPSVCIVHDEEPGSDSFEALEELAAEVQDLVHEEKAAAGSVASFLSLRPIEFLPVSQEGGQGRRAWIQAGRPALPALVVGVGPSRYAVPVTRRGSSPRDVFDTLVAILAGCRRQEIGPAGIWLVGRLHRPPLPLHRLSFLESLRIAYESWLAVYWLHRDSSGGKGPVLHHDLKPANILLDRALRPRQAAQACDPSGAIGRRCGGINVEQPPLCVPPRVADVGLALHLRPGATQRAHGGTSGYLDPLLLTDKPRVGVKNDVASVATPGGHPPPPQPPKTPPAKCSF